ncbi:MAG: mercury transporter MerT [Acidobacteria bacterium]|nr:mercury transporter MerT [Acidobacteriota bacterium]
MKVVVGSVVAAVAASACCLGPVLLTMIGAGALGAAATSLERYRPVLLGLTVALLASAFVVTYRPGREVCAADGTCAPSTTRRAKIVLWAATVLVVLLATFPYYVNWLL